LPERPEVRYRLLGAAGARGDLAHRLQAAEDLGAGGKNPANVLKTAQEQIAVGREPGRQLLGIRE